MLNKNIRIEQELQAEYDAIFIRLNDNSHKVAVNVIATKSNLRASYLTMMRTYSNSVLFM